VIKKALKTWHAIRHTSKHKAKGWERTMQLRKTLTTWHAIRHTKNTKLKRRARTIQFQEDMNWLKILKTCDSENHKKKRNKFTVQW
jgi:hypothetical protein